MEFRGLDARTRNAYNCPAPRRGTQRLRLLSYNIQVGIDTRRYVDYVTKGWRHVLPDPRRARNLNDIACLLRRFDVVALQEVDGGSLRSGFVDQVRFLALRGGFPLWYRQTNRRLGKLGQHSNALLARYRPTDVLSYRLPAAPGRGALLARYGTQGEELAVITAHLSLRRRSRLRQLAFLAELCADFEHVVLMGDLNCQPDSPEMRLLMHESDLRPGRVRPATFPSWQPMRALDHILVSPGLGISIPRALDFSCSDHLPLAVDIRLPPRLRLDPAHAGHGSARPIDVPEPGGTPATAAA